jgi:integrase
VPIELVEAVKPHVSRQVAALIDLQLLTGARPGELIDLRAIDIDTKHDPWRASLRAHKTAHYGKSRTVYFGPRAREVLAPFLASRPVDAPLFSPREAERERYAACGTHRRAAVVPAATERRIGDCYTVSSYRRAIQYACDLAFPVPEGQDEAAWRKAHRWHPNQLRHTAATEIRREFGLEAAQLVLGHSSALVTDAVYAQRDEAKVAEVLRKVG